MVFLYHRNTPLPKVRKGLDGYKKLNLSCLYFITFSPIHFSVWDMNKKIIYVDTMSVSTYDVWQVQSPKIMM
jgi:hypothetical protein